LRKIGYDIIRFEPNSSDEAKLMAAMSHFGIDLVLDVGANEGQFVLALRDGGFKGRVVSFEPLSAVHAVLCRNAARDGDWQVHPRCAIGDHDGEIKINVAGNAVSSSILPMLAQHADSAPASRYVGSESTPIHRLDAVAMPYLRDAANVFLKIDTQGFEAPVLRGAVETLQRCRAVQLEMSLAPLYQGQELWTYFLREFEAKGFDLWTVLPGFVDPSTGRTLQMDAVFVRR
jgi:FkbM family methyltransferase